MVLVTLSGSYEMFGPERCLGVTESGTRLQKACTSVILSVHFVYQHADLLFDTGNAYSETCERVCMIAILRPDICILYTLGHSFELPDCSKS